MVEGNEMRMLSLMQAGLSRRQLLRGMGLSVAAVATTGLLAACETDDDATASDDAALAAASDDSDDSVDVASDDADEVVDDEDDHDDVEVDPSDRPNLVLAVHGIVSLLDPFSNASLVGHMTQYSIFDTLVRRNWFDADPPGTGNTLEPMLAESWEYLDDTTIEFRLREDVTWHNGDDFDAHDVVYTFESLIGEEVPEWQTNQGHYANLESIEMIDDYTVQMVTSAPDPVFLARLSVMAAYIIPAKYYEEVGREEFGQAPVGTGPYRVVSFTPDEEIVTESHDDYWMGLPNAAGVHFRVIPETSARVAALISGEAHIATNLPPDQIQTLEDADGVHPESIESLNFHMMRFNTHHPYVADPRIRHALCHAIDRQLLVDTLWFGEARVPNGHQFVDYPDHLFFEDIELPYDPDLAMELMEEAGYDGEMITFRVQPDYYTGYEDAAQAIIAMWAEVGFNAEIELGEESWRADEDAIVHNWSNSSNLADPLGAIWTNWGPTGAPQTNFWDAPERFNELGHALSSTLDEDERSELWREMLEIWMEERPGTPLYNPLETYGVSDRIDWKPIAVPYMDLRNYNLNFSSED